MKQKLFVMALALLLPICTIHHANGDLVIDIGSTTVDISAATGVLSTSFDIEISNTGSMSAAVAGYSLFLDIAPTGSGLPAGVSFGNPIATYASGNGTGFLFGASIDGTLDTNPAAGDLGLGQIQFFDAQLGAGQSELLVTVNLEIDAALAQADDYSLFLNPNGQSSISNSSNSALDFTSTSGTLTLVSAIPEPNSIVLLASLCGWVASRRRMRRAT